MLTTRIITAALLLVAFTIDLFLASTAIFALVLAFIVAASAWEWSRLCKVCSENRQTTYAAGAGVIALIFLYLPYSESLMQWLLLAGFLYWLSVPVAFYMRPKLESFEGTRTDLLLVGVFFIVLAAVAIQYLRSLAPHASPWLLLYALSIVWIMDIGAYFSGRRFGRTKLALLISPGKTWEGVYGGLAASFIVMLLVLVSAEFAQGNVFKLVIATVLSAGMSVVGDLAESRIKRAAQVKDSSQLLPGHGGVLDRLDGVLSASVMFAFVWAWM